MAHGAAIAGPYVNVESNLLLTPALTPPVDCTTDVHYGYEGDNWYVQGGVDNASLAPALKMVLWNCPVHHWWFLLFGGDALSLYSRPGLLWAVPQVAIPMGTKVGAKYNF